MPHRLWIVRHDKYHPKEIVDPVVDEVFAASTDWDVQRAEDTRDVIADGETTDVAIFFAAAFPAGESPLDEEEQRRVVALVRSGLGMLRVHAGLVLPDPDGPLQRELNPGRFLSHPAFEGTSQHPVAYVPARNVEHPVLDGVEPFSGFDEHYWCQVDAARTDLLLTSTSGVGTAAAGWAHEAGQGRVCSLTPGHTAEVLGHAQMKRLLDNAARWCLRR